MTQISTIMNTAPRMNGKCLRPQFIHIAASIVVASMVYVHAKSPKIRIKLTRPRQNLIRREMEMVDMEI